MAEDKELYLLKKSIGINVNTSRSFSEYGEKGEQVERFIQYFAKNLNIIFPGKIYIVETEEVELYQKTLLLIAQILNKIGYIDYCKMISVNDIVSGKYSTDSITIREELGKNYILGVMDMFDAANENIQYISRIQNFFSTWLSNGKSLILMTEKNPRLTIEASPYYKWFQSVLKSNLIGGLV
jgi:hypothetical protein